MVRAGHAAYTDRFHELDSNKAKDYTKAVQISGALTDEAVRNGSIKKVEKRGNVGEPSKDRSGRDDNKRTRTENAFATVNPVGRENTSTWPKCTTCNSYHAPGGPYRTCFNYNRLSYLEKDGRGVPRNVNPVNARNLIVRACYECGSTDHVRNQGNQPLSLYFDFVFASEIFKSLSFCLDRLCRLAILCLDQHAHTLHHLESLLTISLDRLDIFEGRSCISEFVRKSLSLILELS
ncbi:hypothetical protein Tco_1135908 [Tanacetum coccineum]